MKKTCYGCKAVEVKGRMDPETWKGGEYVCGLGYQVKPTPPNLPQHAGYIKPLQECPKPTTYATLFELEKAGRAARRLKARHKRHAKKSAGPGQAALQKLKGK